MQRTLILSAVIASSVLLAGCGGKSSGPAATSAQPAVAPINTKPGYEKTLIPFKVGNKWTYSLEQVQVRNGQRSGGTSEVVYQVTKLDGTLATLEISQDNKLIDRQVWQLNDKGLYQISISKNNIPYVPAQPIALFPIDKNKSFKWTGTGITAVGKSGNQTVQTYVRDVMEVDSPAGRFNAIPFESTFDLTGGVKGKGTSTTYLTPGVGIVRYAQKIEADVAQATVLLKLKSKNF
jgi:hypothetical protein